jgi:hypothetical protein
MNRDVCGICWALYDDEGRCECPQVQEPPRRTGLPHCERSCEANAFKIEIRRLKAEKQEIGAALRRLISYCHTLENRLMEADGEHPALQQAKEAYAKAET